jgi:hypothetical protein
MAPADQFQQVPGYSTPPKQRRNCQVQELTFARGEDPHHGKAGHSGIMFGDQKIVRQVVSNIPMGSLRAGRLDGRNRR